MRKKLISELGNFLPFGLVYENKIYKTFNLKPWRMKEERELAKFEGQNLTAGQIIVKTLSVLISSFDNLEFSALSQTAKELILTQMYMGDVFSIYIRARIENLGANMPTLINCGECGKRFRFDADLNTFEVLAFENEDPINYSFPFELEDGVEIEGKIYKKLKCKLAKFESFASIPVTRNFNSAIFRTNLFQNAVIGIENYKIEPFLFLETHIDTLSKKDLENLANKIFMDSVAVDFGVEAKCPACGAMAGNFLNWGADNFFAQFSGR